MIPGKISPPTGKERSQRIRPEYIQTAGPWERRKALAAVVAAVAAAAWWTAGVLLGRQNAAFHSPGNLATVHRMWESQCSACHVDFHPIRGDTIAAQWKGGTAESDQKCATCHRGAEHHAVDTPRADVALGCSACHREHQGAQASLLRMDDRACTGCHQDIRQVAAHSALPQGAIGVTRFDAEHHPEFTRVEDRATHLRFSHRLHMTPGLVRNPADTETALTPAKIADLSDPPRAAPYRREGQGDDAPVQLACESCHRLDGDGFVTTGSAGVVGARPPARAAGGYMLPIVYENQCQACHPLYKTPGVVQHRQTADEMRAALQRKFAADALAANPDLLSRAMPPQALPNARPIENETVRQGIARNVATAEKELSQEYCGKCHEFAASGPGLRPVVPPRLRQICFEHAKFDHRAHRAMDCAACHTPVVRNDPNDAEGKADMRLPTRDVCLKCHSPPAQSGSAPTGGARFDCVECHRYHNAAPLAGGGADGGGPKNKLTEQEFQAGGTR